MVSNKKDVNRCCFYCHKRDYVKDSHTTNSPQKTYLEEVTSTVDTPKTQTVGEERMLSLTPASQRIPLLEDLLLTPPLRKITVAELSSVRLRKSDFQKLVKTPEVNDMLSVLRKRYAVMHISFTSENDSIDTEETDDYIASMNYNEVVC
ncbi:hypothetical protein JTB14_001715 [Gonioctena quinquepunctata]|nr:hypothetical protein JTB14_001715 [Gonioctena quinquepunctata]